MPTQDEAETLYLDLGPPRCSTYDAPPGTEQAGLWFMSTSWFQPTA